MTKDWCPEVKAKPCEHGTTPWTDCEACLKSSTTSAHFTHNEQWTPRKQALQDHAHENPFGDISRD